MKLPRQFVVFFACLVIFVAAQTQKQPRVAPGPNEPNWWDILETIYGLKMFEDLENPVRTTAGEVTGLFRKSGPGPVVFEPVLAFGTETRTHGGWYPVSSGGSPEQHSLWSYQFKNSPAEVEAGAPQRPPLDDASRVEFDPGDQPFGLWVSNENFQDGGVYSEPTLVARLNSRLAPQPYKVMVYRLRDKSTGRAVPNAFLMGWEYSTNDDFQDVVCIVRNANLVSK